MSTHGADTARVCEGCGDTFYGQYWHRVCKPCWFARRDGDVRRQAYREGYSDGIAAERQTAPFDRELLSDVIRLSHPDAHPPERFALANRTTARLLEIRAELRAAA